LDWVIKMANISTLKGKSRKQRQKEQKRLEWLLFTFRDSFKDKDVELVSFGKPDERVLDKDGQPI